MSELTISIFPESIFKFSEPSGLNLGFPFTEIINSLLIDSANSNSFL